MKLSAWAKQNGISYQTAFNWFKSKKLPVKSIQTDTGTILVYPESELEKNKNAYIYCRVSTSERKDSLKGQEERCLRLAESKGLCVKKVYKEIASGMNDSRPKLMDLLSKNPEFIIVENKDRLTRFGFNYLDILIKKSGGEILVLNESENDEQDLIKDMISIMTSFCCRLYGLRRGNNKAAKIKQVIQTSDD